MLLRCTKFTIFAPKFEFATSHKMKQLIKIIYIFLGFSFVPIMQTKANAQSVGDIIADSYSMMSSDIEKAKSKIAGVSLSQVEELSDSLQYMFYYTASNTALVQGQKQFEYLKKAKGLREKSVGINSSEYLSIIWLLGYYMEKKDSLDAAMNYYNEGIIKGMNLTKYPTDDMVGYWYAELLNCLANGYVKKGFYDEAEKLFLTAFDASKDYPGTSLFTSPLNNLYMMYAIQGKDKDASETAELELMYIKEYLGEVNEYYVMGLYNHAASIIREGKLKEGIEEYEKATSIILKHKKEIRNSYSNLEMITSNLIVSYAKSNDFTSVKKKIKPYKEYCEKAGVMSEFHKTIYVAALELERLGNNEDAAKLRNIELDQK